MSDDWQSTAVDSGARFLGGDSLVLIPEAARLLRVSEKTVRRLIIGGKLRSAKLCGKRLISMNDLNALVRGSTV